MSQTPSPDSDEAASSHSSRATRQAVRAGAPPPLEVPHVLPPTRRNTKLDRSGHQAPSLDLLESDSPSGPQRPVTQSGFFQQAAAFVTAPFASTASSSTSSVAPVGFAPGIVDPAVAEHFQNPEYLAYQQNQGDTQTESTDEHHRVPQQIQQPIQPAQAVIQGTGADEPLKIAAGAPDGDPNGDPDDSSDNEEPEERPGYSGGAGGSDNPNGNSDPPGNNDIDSEEEPVDDEMATSQLEFQTTLAALRSRVAQFQHQLKEHKTKVTELSYLDAQLLVEDLKELGTEFTALHRLMYKAYHGLPKELNVDETPLQIAEAFYDAINADFLKARSKATAVVKSLATLTGQGLKPPKLQLPIFTGNHAQWLTFKSAFKALVIDCKAFAPSEKLRLLKDSVKGNAEDSIKDLQPTDKNWEPAWERLTSRYDSPRESAHGAVKPLLELPPLMSQTGTGLFKLLAALRTTRAHIKEIELGTVTEAEVLYSHLVLSRLDTKTIKDFNQTLTGNEVPTLQTLTDWLEKHARSLDLTQEIKQGSAKTHEHRRGRDNRQNPPVLSVADCKVQFNKNQERGRSKSPKTQGRSASHQQRKDVLQQQGAKSNPNRNTSPYPRTMVRSQSPAPFNQCPVCNSPKHSLAKCPDYVGYSHSDKQDWVRANNRCYNCLGAHIVKQCTSKFSCLHCKKKHHTSLHVDSAVSTILTLFSSQSKLSPLPAPGTIGILPTAIVAVTNSPSDDDEARCLFDSGAEKSFITLAAANRLGLKIQGMPQQFVVAGGQVTSSLGQVFLKIANRNQYTLKFSLTASVLPKITCPIPGQYFSTKGWNHINKLQLADPTFNQPGEIDLLLGAGFINEVMIGKKILGSSGMPSAYLTEFGYIVQGQVSASPLCSVPKTELKRSTEQIRSTDSNSIFPSFRPSKRKVSQSFSHKEETLRIFKKPPGGANVHSKLTGTPTYTPPPPEEDGQTGNQTIPFQIEKFWEIEDLPPQVFLTPLEKFAEDHFLKHYSRLDNGRFQVRWPFLASTELLGNSYKAAVSRWLAMERKLVADPVLASEYHAQLQDYLDNNELEPIPFKEMNKQPHFWVPHHSVQKPTSTTTKLRIVFDASAKTTSGKSINALLAPGPVVQSSLFEQLLKFRKGQIGMTADIAKMYRQIHIHPDERDFARIIWRKHPNDDLEFYRLKSIPFGMASSPFLATRCLQQLAKEEMERFPRAAEALLTSFYVDDFLFSQDSLDTAMEFKNELLALLATAQMSLRKWSSNSPELLETLSPDLRETQLPLDMNANATVGTLGLNWNPATDTFQYSVNLPSRDQHTKRSALSDISKTFDPLGLLAPTIVVAKMLMQKIWTYDVGWDDPLPHSILTQWLTFASDLPGLLRIIIPRWLGSSSANDIQLHGFCDASEKAYSAAVYIRTETPEGFTCRLITAKTRVAPVKLVTIPRLELQGAVLLAELMDVVAKQYSVKSPDIFFWTDSTICLHWIYSHPSKWKIYVANRVKQIQDLSPCTQWNHVTSEQNPADVASRGLSSTELLQSSLWWNGPSWLSTEFTVPRFNPQTDENSWNVYKETKPCLQIYYVNSVDEHYIIKCLTRISSWTKAIHVVSRLLRIGHSKSFKGYKDIPLTSQLISEAELKITQMIQSQPCKDVLNGSKTNPIWSPTKWY